MTVLLFYTVGASLVVIAIVAGVVISTKARRLDALHKNILRSRAALENALNTRARVAQEVAHSGVLDLAGSVVLDSAAQEAGDAAGYILVDDGLDKINLHGLDDSSIILLHHGGPDRLALESELSRVLRFTVDELDETDHVGYEDIMTKLLRARQSVRLTRRFHNIHVAGARRIRQSPLARLFRIHGYASWPQTIDLDDE
ncbi:hypothetical protein JTE88_04110 [Arcanobacterium phocisimile]|uniref:Secreted protein n=1 Tax=Arcanobacterium phocisimile TaxID=1302235 RepID=A0ABX7IIF1_9ACTO|nr:hypothetical protein [Arcanobacterium phocisimile]QRV02908.1 hypothetical protein JTE88_04110 [Arcanobacterium phocisimile]